MAKIIANYVSFIRTGTTVDAVTVSKTVKPDHLPVENWTDYNLDCVSSIAPSVNNSTVKSRCPNASGAYVKTDEILTESEILWVATFEELTLLPYELLFGTGQLTAAASATVMAGAAQAEGWVWLQQKDHLGNTILDAEFWAIATIQGINFEEDITRPVIQFAMVDAGALGTVTVSNV
tara:strand:+ start:493 stop:1026 length:534 start_codon:yes stop_codon:yes gene_type:complete